MFNFLKKKTFEQKALEHLVKYAKEINKDKLGPLGAIIKFTDELKENKLHQELNIINEKELQHPKAYYLCASLMLLSFNRSGVYDSLQNDVNIEELAKSSYVACSRIITDNEFLQIVVGSATDHLKKRNEEEQKHISAWDSWLNNLEVLKSVFK
jgi:hypothetical protein